MLPLQKIEKTIPLIRFIYPLYTMMVNNLTAIKSIQVLASRKNPAWQVFGTDIHYDEKQGDPSNTMFLSSGIRSHYGSIDLLRCGFLSFFSLPLNQPHSRLENKCLIAGTIEINIECYQTPSKLAIFGWLGTAMHQVRTVSIPQDCTL